MDLFYAPPAQINGDRIELTGREARHAFKVLRYQKGDRIRITDGAGTRYCGTVEDITGKRAVVGIEHRKHEPTVTPEYWLAMGIIKKRDRLEFAVEKAVELGVRKILLFRSDHTIKKNVRIDRLETVALSAMKQSLRCHLPEIHWFESFKQLLNEHATIPKLIAHEKKGGAADRLENSFSSTRKLMLLVGPEGGFSEEEVDRAVDSGGKVVSLGEYRLRSETAAIALLSRCLN